MATLKAKSTILNIVIEQGATFSWAMTWKDGTGTPIDLTGCTARMTIKKTKISATPIIELTTASEIVLGDALGTIVITIDAVTTASFNFDNAVYDLEIIYPSTYVDRLLKGAVTLDKEVTK